MASCTQGSQSALGFKRQGDPLSGPQPKRPTNFVNLKEGTDYIKIQHNGEFKYVLMEDVQNAASNYANSQTQFASPPHTRSGAGYTPVRFPSQNPQYRYIAPTQIRQASVSTQQRQQQLKINNQQLQLQMQSPSTFQTSSSTALPATPSTFSPSNQVEHSIDSVLVAKVNKIDKAVFHHSEGLEAINLKVQELAVDVQHDTEFRGQIAELKKGLEAVQTNNIQISVDGNQASHFTEQLQSLAEKDRIREDKLNLLTSIVHRQSKEIESLKHSAVTTTAMFMINTLYIGGIRQEVMENCKNLVLDFLRERMHLTPPPQEIISAKRSGEVQTKTIRGVKYPFPPAIEVNCSPVLRQAMWECKTVLKGQMDPDYKWKFYITNRRPEEMKAANSRYKDLMETVFKANEGKPLDERDVPRIIGNKFMVNGEVISDPVYPPDVQTLMSLSQTDVKSFAQVQFEVSDAYPLAKSNFRGFCLPISCYQDVDFAYKKLKYEERFATHIMMGCQFQEGRKLESFSCDDGEASGGIEIVNVLKSTKAVGYAIFVIRWKLGGNIGPRRFGCIRAVAKQALEKLRSKSEILNNARGFSQPPPPGVSHISPLMDTPPGSAQDKKKRQ